MRESVYVYCVFVRLRLWQYLYAIVREFVKLFVIVYVCVLCAHRVCSKQAACMLKVHPYKQVFARHMYAHAHPHPHPPPF